MTRTEIMAIIKATNTNGDVKWKVEKANKHLIALSNDYCGSTRFNISYEVDEEGWEWIKVHDTGMDENAGCFMRNPEWDNRSGMNDFITAEDGFKQGVACAVNYFNYYY